MSWGIVYTNSASRDLNNLDENTAKRIALKIKYYAAQNNPLNFAKKLNPPFDNLYRFRIGEYRAVFELGKDMLQILIILRIKHRKEVYE